ncbi:unnamed protein product [Mytilus coruscus]|uniref:IFT140 second beta-propeller domain-containing protein n=1 Tax=Mytilus coruscus TaxID=42192 RepID=A0A6J8A2S6_MYTCO|nr:unnamed protein product [Mytilus coruscus]
MLNVYGTDAHYISLSIKPLYITKVDSNTVAVSCTSKTILIINICTGSVTSSIETSSRCYGIVYDENNLYVVNENEIDVMDLTGKFKSTIPIPSLNGRDISVYKDTLVCIDNKSIYYCSLDGTLKWQFKNDKFKNLRGVTTDGEGNVYVTDEWTNIVCFVSDICNRFGDILNGLENVLLVCNAHVGKAFLFDIKKELA